MSVLNTELFWIVHVLFVLRDSLYTYNNIEDCKILQKQPNPGEIFICGVS